MLSSLVPVGLLLLPALVSTADYSYIDLPSAHIPYYFQRFPKLTQQCLADDECPYQHHLSHSPVIHSYCWGYEDHCTPDRSFQQPHCPGDYRDYVKSKEAQIAAFYGQADFGYVRDQIDELTMVCEPRFAADSSLECSKFLRFCRGRNIMVNFTALLGREEPIRYKMDVLEPGGIGGHCRYKQAFVDEEAQHVSPLQSWAPEVRFFTRLKERPIESGACDVVVDRPTFFMKIDAVGNMYHHFCDFFNLYASLHVNMSHPQAFSRDVHMLVWESFTYESPFAAAFDAFTQHPVWDLKTFRGKVVCFRNLVLPLLPRMIFGLYYNTPLIAGCEDSGLFHAFGEFVTHRLQIRQAPRTDRKVRITMLVRRTKFRRILNEDALFEALAANDAYSVKRVNFGRELPFKEQMRIVRNTDVLVGIHGAGLTHLLFLPRWAALFELYNCGDPSCYKDLARLRGVKYVTWEDETKAFPEDEGQHPEEGGAHAKFTNYAFDVDEFVRLVRRAADHVRDHQEFKSFLDVSLAYHRDEL